MTQTTQRDVAYDHPDGVSSSHLKVVTMGQPRPQGFSCVAREPGTVPAALERRPAPSNQICLLNRGHTDIDAVIYTASASSFHSQLSTLGVATNGGTFIFAAQRRAST